MFHAHNLYTVRYIPCSDLLQFRVLFWHCFFVLIPLLKLLMLMLMLLLMFIHCDLMIFGIYYLLIVVHEHHTCVYIVVCALVSTSEIFNGSQSLTWCMCFSVFVFFRVDDDFLQSIEQSSFVSNSFLINFFHRRRSFYFCLMAFELLCTFHFNSMWINVCVCVFVKCSIAIVNHLNSL